MNLLPNEQQQEILSVVSSFTANELSVRRLQQAENRGSRYSQALWQQLVELGWFGIGISEQQGGLGLGIADEMLLAREAGRQLMSPTVLATAFACHLASANQQQDLLADLIAGKTRVALALASRAMLDGEQLSGDVSVFDGDGMDTATDAILICAQQACYLVSGELLAELSPSPCTDESLAMHIGECTQVPVLASSKPAQLQFLLGQYLAAALVGISEATLDAAANYAKEREQFGKPIGSFQAINHLCADMAVRCAAAWSQTVATALNFELERPSVPQDVASQALMSEQAALENSRANIQIHGGVGFTVEYDAHYYLKRSHVYRNCLKQLIPVKPLLLAA